MDDLKEKRINLLIARLEFEAVQMCRCGEPIWEQLATEAAKTLRELMDETATDRH